MKIDKEQAQQLRHDIMHDNKILYCMNSRSYMETTMCWGFECGDGWLNAIDEMSKSLEALNYIFYPKFRVRVQMDQVKEKFGELHAYHSIVCDPPVWMCKWHNLFQKLFDKIERLDFKKVQIFDRAAYDEINEIELASREEYEKEKKENARIANVEVYEKNGKFFKKSTYTHYAKTHWAPTRLKLLHRLLNYSYLIVNLPIRLFNFEPSHQQKCIEELLEDKVRAIIAKAEKECYSACELCGQHISDNSKWSPRCTTRGWIQYLCKDCASASKYEYVMNGAVYEEGKEILSKEDYAKEKEKIEARFKQLEEENNED